MIRSFSRPWVSLNFYFLGCAIFGYLVTRWALITYYLMIIELAGFFFLQRLVV